METQTTPARGGAALKVRGLVKSYGSTRALKGVDLDVRAGEILALVGGNGSGKSTLVKSLAGVTRPDAGRLTVAGRERDLTSFSPADSRALGLHMVHQHRSTFDDMTVAENLSIGRGFETQAGRIRWRRARQRAARLIEQYGIGCRPGDPVSSLGPAAHTMLEIARALQDRDRDAGGVLVLDEPTASLPPHEVDFLLESLQRFADEGQAVLFISHRLDEVMAIADRVAGLRDGRMVGTLAAGDLDREALIELIAGRAVEMRSSAPAESAAHEPPVLQVEGLAGGAVRRAGFELRPGEIVGIAGLAGSGRSSLLRMLFGAQRAEAGSVRLEGAPYHPLSPADGMRRRVAFVPEDRPADAVFPELSIAENLSVGHMRHFRRLGVVDRAAERKAGRAAIRRFGIKTRSERTPISNLSGGNQQKVSVARWLLNDPPSVLLLDEPSQGVDVGARSELWEIVRDAAGRGTAILFVSSDTEELIHLSQRILLMRDGRVGESVSSAGLTPETLNQQLHRTEVTS